MYSLVGELERLDGRIHRADIAALYLIVANAEPGLASAKLAAQLADLLAIARLALPQQAYEASAARLLAVMGAARRV